MTTKADYIMVGGFLGAGKTTALVKLAGHLTRNGRRVGLITNDQSTRLVDTTLAGAGGFPVEEITGGCFCCRFNSLTEAAERLRDAARPDAFLAEPVGSCTDLRASVQYPLRRLYGGHYRIAPLSVLVDPVRAQRVLGQVAGRAFSPKVVYIYEKQLEEADIIVVNKTDIVDAAALERLRMALGERYPQAEVFAVSVRTGSGLDEWFERIAAGESGETSNMDLDYDIYADGEARLGWSNGTFHVEAARAFDGNALLRGIAEGVKQRLGSKDLEIAHLKAVLTPDDNMGDLGAVNLVGGDRDVEQSHRLQDLLTAGELIINLRAEGPPDALSAAIRETLDETAGRAGARVRAIHHEHFAPPRPVPTYRMAPGVD